MVDLTDILGNLDLGAVVLPDDKLKECHYFYGLMSKETDQDQFRWQLGAFLNACYGHLEHQAAYTHYAQCDPDTGETVKDLEALEILRQYVRVFETKVKKQDTVKTAGLSELTEQLYRYRNRSTHDGGLEVMRTGDDLPQDFHIGKYRGEGVPALEFCTSVLEFFAELEIELATV